MPALLAERFEIHASALHPLHLVTDGNFTAFDHETVERKLAVETSVNASGEL